VATNWMPGSTGIARENAGIAACHADPLVTCPTGVEMAPIPTALEALSADAFNAARHSSGLAVGGASPAPPPHAGFEVNAGDESKEGVAINPLMIGSGVVVLGLLIVLWRVQDPPASDQSADASLMAGAACAEPVQVGGVEQHWSQQQWY